MNAVLWSEKSWVISLIILFSAICRKAFGYPEIHFVLVRGLSFIARRVPEIVFDAPWRVGRGKPIPITCIINDAHKYPIELLNVKVQVFGEGLQYQTTLFPKSAEESLPPLLTNLFTTQVKTRYWYLLEHVQLPEYFAGPAYIIPQVEILLRGKRRTITVDNLPGLSRAPLRTYVSDDALPTFDGWYYGDPHFHSDKTMDQIEFGAPVEVAATFAKAIGLNWFAVTDHSYDLDAPLDDDFAIDQNLPRWKNLKAEVRDVNFRFDDLVVLLGEEVSCGNSKGQNVHLLVYGMPEFIPGRGDAGKTGFAFEFHPNLSISEILDIVAAKQCVRPYDGVAYAAHPDADNAFLGRLVLNRGTWLDEDCKLPGCSGLQFWNGCSGKRYTKGYKRWIRLLLEGYKRYTIAGSDAHGDFNRIRKMIFPFAKLGESTKSSFAKPRTALHCGAT